MPRRGESWDSYTRKMIRMTMRLSRSSELMKLTHSTSIHCFVLELVAQMSLNKERRCSICITGSSITRTSVSSRRPIKIQTLIQSVQPSFKLMPWNQRTHMWRSHSVFSHLSRETLERQLSSSRTESEKTQLIILYGTSTGQLWPTTKTFKVP